MENGDYVWNKYERKPFQHASESHSYDQQTNACEPA